VVEVDSLDVARFRLERGQGSFILRLLPSRRGAYVGFDGRKIEHRQKHNNQTPHKE